MIDFYENYNGDLMTIMVSNGADNCKGMIIENPDESLTTLETLTFNITYPLTNPVKVAIGNPGGFTRKHFIEAVYAAYKSIYDEEGNENVVPSGMGLLNRGRSFGPYGIWGHDLTDLYLEGAEIDEEGNVMLAIGS